MVLNIALHDGEFHPNDVLATSVLILVYPDCKITRTRDEKVLQSMDLVYDVGKVYDPSNNRFDYKQEGFTETYSEKYDVLLCSSGLIYKHFKDKLLRAFNIDCELCGDFIYWDYFMSVDCTDRKRTEVRGRVVKTELSDTIRQFNNKGSDDFMDAVRYCKEDLRRYLEDVKLLFNHYYTKISNLIGGTPEEYIFIEEDVPLSFIEYIIDINNHPILFVILKTEKGFTINKIENEKFSDCTMRLPEEMKRADTLDRAIEIIKSLKL